MIDAYEQRLAEMKNYNPIDSQAGQGEQNSIEWLYSRVGFCTASRFRDAMDILKTGKPGAKRTAYLWEIIAERITGRPTEHFVTQAMALGTEREPMARIAYEAATGSIVTQTGFVHHPTIAWVGGSPDGLVDDDGGVEFKCPGVVLHLKTILAGMDDEHIPQVQGLMWIHGRQWWDFGSYNPEVDRMPLYIQRIPRDDDYIAELSANVLNLLAEVETILAQIGEKITGAASADIAGQLSGAPDQAPPSVIVQI